MMVPSRGGDVRSGIGSVLSGRIVFTDVLSTGRPTVTTRYLALVATRAAKVHGDLSNANRRTPLRGGGGHAVGAENLVVTQVLGGVLPLRDVFRDHPRRLHRGLTQLGIA